MEQASPRIARLMHNHEPNPPRQDHAYTGRMALAQRLRWWRETNNLKIAAAAECLGVSTSAWGHWETGERFPSGEMLLALARFTSLPLRVLLCPNLESCPFVLAGDMASIVSGIPCCKCGQLANGNLPP